MLDAIKIHGVYGIVIGLKRLLRCNPWGGSGIDPVPEKRSNLNSKVQEWVKLKN